MNIQTGYACDHIEGAFSAIVSKEKESIRLGRPNIEVLAKRYKE